MKILLTGRNGQVGWELERALPGLGEVVALDRAALDLADFDAIRRVVRQANPEVIVNAAAFTAVDKAESDPALAMRINAEAPGVLAQEAKRAGALLVHYSTDYVFDGGKTSPYVESDAPNPLNAYGRSKLAGEEAIGGVSARHLIFRTGWVYSARGSNFFLTMLKLLATRPAVRVVDDQLGAPTWCRDLAGATVGAIAGAAAPGAHGTYHLSAAGETSWYGFASSIAALMREQGHAVSAALAPVSSREYAAPATRPANCRLDNARFARAFGTRLRDWEPAVRACFAEWRCV